MHGDDQGHERDSAGTPASAPAPRDSAGTPSRAVLTVIGRDRVGIVAKVATVLADAGANIEDISQTLMQGLFTMVMLVSLDEAVTDFAEMQRRLAAAGEELSLKIELQHEDVFRYMHRV